MPAGQPPFFDNADDLQKEVDAYFDNLKDLSQPATITSLAFYLGFASRQSLYDYEKNDEFSYTIKRARLRIEIEYETKLHSKNPTGAIFALKNFGWTDRQEIEQSGSINLTFKEAE